MATGRGSINYHLKLTELCAAAGFPNPEGVCTGLTGVAGFYSAIGQLDNFSQAWSSMFVMQPEQVLNPANSFFWSLDLLQNPHRYIPVQAREFPSNLDYKLRASALLAQNLQQPNGQLFFAGRFFGAYSQGEIVAQMKLLRQLFVEDEIAAPVQIFINSSSHVVELIYRPGKESYDFVDAHVGRVVSVKDESIGRYLANYLQAGELNVVGVIITTGVGNVLPTQNAIKKLKESKVYLDANVITEQRANAFDCNGVNLLNEAIIADEHAVVSELLRCGANPNPKVKDSRLCPLFEAVHSGNEVAIKLLLEAGANTEIKSIHQQTALGDAVEYGNEKMVELLLRYKADVNARIRKGYSILHMAARHNLPNIIQLLHKYQVNYDVKISTETASLINFAEGLGRGDEMKLYFKNIMDEHQYVLLTPMHLAALYGNSESVVLLLEYLPLILKTPACLIGAYKIAAVMGHQEVMKHLKSAIEIPSVERLGLFSSPESKQKRRKKTNENSSDDAPSPNRN